MEGIEKTEFPACYEFITVSDVVKQAINRESSTAEETLKTETSTILNSGFRDLDHIIQSFNSKQLISIAVRPGKGKTAFLLSLIHNLALTNNKRIAVFSPERSAIKLVQRLIESETGNSAERVYSGTYKESDKEKVDLIISKFIQSEVIIDDSTSLNITEITNRCKYLVEEQHVDMILFDNIELYSKNILDSDINFFEQEKMMSEISLLTKSINIPILLLTHSTNINNLIDINDKPTIDNVAPFIKQHSDVVVFIHRPNLLNFHKPEFSEWKGCAELILIKHPEVNTPSSIKLKFIESSDRFTDF
ncbi:MAG: DnaB-like helicase C-terminal domain-containing protein [Bacteroidota bacterium]